MSYFVTIERSYNAGMGIIIKRCFCRYVINQSVKLAQNKFYLGKLSRWLHYLSTCKSFRFQGLEYTTSSWVPDRDTKSKNREKIPLSHVQIS